MNKLQLSQVLPHQPPMVLLNEFVNAGEDSACCRVVISSESPFFDAHSAGVPAYVGIEYMAQTVAAYSGALSRRSGGEPKLGFLLGTRKLRMNVTKFHLGQQLEIHVEKIVQDSTGLSVFSCAIYDMVESQVLIEAKLNLFQPENGTDWLQEQA